MLTTTTCCLNLLPPISSQVFNAPRLSLVKHEACRRRQLVGMRVACIVALQMAHLLSAPQPEAVALDHNMPFQHVALISQSGDKVAKWSEQRVCPASRHNSFETIVPENLPRPTARRRYESVHSSLSHNAPPLQNTNPHCFSL